MARRAEAGLVERMVMLVTVVVVAVDIIAVIAVVVVGGSVCSSLIECGSMEQFVFARRRYLFGTAARPSRNEGTSY
jgi:hypothetical protein